MKRKSKIAIIVILVIGLFVGTGVFVFADEQLNGDLQKLNVLSLLSSSNDSDGGSAFHSSKDAATYSGDLEIGDLDEEISGSDDESVSWSYNADTKTLTVYGTGNMENYEASDEPPWANYSSEISKIIIKSGVTSIGDFAFAACRSLTSITIPDSVTSIGDYAFQGCRSLTSITIPDSVTSIGEDVFGWCSSLTSITIPGNVTSIGDRAFYCCSDLANISVASNNANYSSQDGVLFNKNRTVLICYPVGKEQAQYNIPNSVTSIGDGAFEDCDSLMSMIIPNSVTSIGDSAFEGCESLTSITIPDSVTSIGDSAFEGCESLTSIIIPDSVTSIGFYAFDGCSNLTSITIPGNVTSIGDGAFYGCSNLANISVASNNADYSSQDGVLFNKNRTVLICYPAGKEQAQYTIPNSVTLIRDHAFEECGGLTSITIPDSVTSIGDSAFTSCRSLTSIIIPDSVTSIGEYAFYECSSLVNITIPTGVTLIENDVFANCGSLTSVTIPKGVTSIEYGAFYYCSNLTSITIPDSVISIEEYAFSNCYSLTSVIIPDSVTSIGEYAFDDCSGLTNLIISDSITSINSFAFFGCSSLTSVTIPDNVVLIEENAFDDCTHLTQIIIPNSVTEIKAYAFTDCCSLSDVYYTGTVEQWKNIIIAPSPDIDGNDYFKNATIHYNYYNLEQCKHTYTAVITSATCTERGYTTFTCTKCGESYVADYVEALGHSFTNYVSNNDATCTQDGTKTAKCDRCDVTNTVRDIGSVLRHNYYIGTVTAPTCTEMGYTTYICTRCNNTYSDYIKALGHSFTNYVSNNDATCTQDGTKTAKCDRCDVTNTVSDTGSALGHDFGINYEKDYCSNGCGTANPNLIIGDCGEKVKWNFNTKSGKLSIVGYGNMYDYSEKNRAPWYEYREDIISLEMSDELTSIGNYAFYGCYNLKNIIIPKKVKSIGTRAFYQCNSLISISVDSENINYSSNNGVLFDKSQELLVQYPLNSSRTSYIVPDTVKTIGEYAFGIYEHDYWQYHLTDIKMSDGVTIIEKGAFYNQKLVSVTIPYTVKTIGKYVFTDRDKNLKDIYYSGSEYEWNSIVFESSNNGLSNATIHYNYGQCEHTYNDGVIIKNPTCTKNGTKEFTCTKCGRKYSENIIAPGHEYILAITAPKCTEKGYTTYTCTRCKNAYKANYTDALGHIEVVDEAVAPTCTTTGLTEGKHCSRCSEVLVKQQTVVALGHSFTNYVSNNDATCIQDGTKTAKCDRCDVTNTVTDTGSALGHNYNSKVTAPTCTEKGYTTYTCTRCKNAYKADYTDALGHAEVTDKAVAPTCTATGLTEGKHCSRCGEVLAKQQTVAALGHSFTNYVSNNDATCTQDGTKTAKCDRCDETNTVSDTGSALGHSFTNYVSNNDATCTQDGTKTAKCDRCDVTNTVTDTGSALGHNYSSRVTAPTCTEKGYTTYTCTRCKNTYKADYTDALGHIEIVDKAVAPTCTTTGLTEGKHCSRCGEVLAKQQTVAALGHDFGEWSVAVQPTCTKKGTKQRTCLRCGLTEKDEVPAIGHNYGEWKITKAATVLAEGEKQKECTRCGDVAKEKIAKVEVDLDKTDKYGMANFTVVNAQTKQPINKACIFIKTENDGENTLITDKDGKVSAVLPVGKQTVSAYAEGCLVRTLKINVTTGQNDIPLIGLSDKPGYDASIKHHEMTLEEIKEAGIDTSAAENNHIYKYELRLDFEPEIDWESVFAYFDGNGNYMGGSYGGGSSSGSSSGSGSSGSSAVNREIHVRDDLTVVPVTEYFYIIIRGEVKWLKEMFDVEMLVLNNSDTDTMEDMTATLNLPDGLSLATMSGEQQSLTKNIGHIEESGQRKVNWYIRGDKAGSYGISATLKGKTMPFEEEIDNTYTSSDMLQVLAGSALNLEFEFPDAAYYAEDYPVKITLTNVSNKPIYKINHIVQIEQGMKIIYIDSKKEEKKIEKSNWETIGVESFNPGDQIIIESSTNVFFKSKVMEERIKSYIGVIDDIEKLYNAYKLFETVYKIATDLVGSINGAISALNDFSAGPVLETEKIKCAKELKTSLGDLILKYSTSGNSVIDAALKSLSSVSDIGFSAFLESPDEWLKNSSVEEINQVINQVYALGNCVEKAKSNPDQIKKFNIFDSIRALISSLPVKFSLKDVIMTEDELNTTSIPWSYKTYSTGAHYFGVSSVSKYLSNISKAMMSDFYKDAVPSYIQMLPGCSDPFDGEQAKREIIATENEIKAFQARTASGKTKITARYVKNEQNSRFARMLSSIQGDDFELSCSDNDTAVYEDGVLTFTGNGTIEFLPKSTEGGTLYVEDSDGNVVTYEIGVVKQHTCSASSKTTIIPPTAATDGFAVKCCDICGEILDVEILSSKECDHEFGEWIVDTQPTCATEGVKHRECSVCGYTETDFIGKSNHVFDSAKVTKAATCTESGEETFTCSVCNETVTKEIPALGHKFVSFSRECLNGCGERNPDYHQSGSGNSGSCGSDVSWGYDQNTKKLYVYGQGSMDDSGTFNKSPWNEYSDDIESIEIENGVSSIGEKAFSGCYNLRSVFIPESVCLIGERAFYQCNALKNIDVDESNNYYCSVDGVLFNKEKTVLIQYPVDSDRADYVVPSTVETIGDYSFAIYERGYWRYNLVNVYLQNGVTEIGKNAFYGQHLASVSLPKTLADIKKYAFPNRENSLKDVFYNGSETEWKQITVGSSNSALSKATVHYNVEPVVCEHEFEVSVKIGPTCTTEGEKEHICKKCGYKYTEPIAPLGHDFKDYSDFCINGCQTLNPDLQTGECGESVDWRYNSTTKTLTVTGSGDMYDYDSSNQQPWASFRDEIATVKISDGVTSVGDSSFEDCTNLADVSISNSVSYIGSYAFKNCSALSEIEISNGVTSIEFGAFYNCTSLKFVKISNGVTTIKSHAFRGCDNLTEIVVPNSVTAVESYAFAECSNLKYVCFGGTEEEWNSLIIGKHNGAFKNATVYYGTLECEHDFIGGIVLKMPTCTTDGRKEYSCKKCGYSKFETIEALGHEYTKIAVIAPTCAEKGHTVYTCVRCESSYNLDYTDALGHIEVVDETVAPTCTATGLTEGKHCSRCGEVLAKQQTVVALGHSFTNYVNNNDATCTQDGTKTAKCDRCDETNTVTDTGSALGHIEIVDEAVAPTCTATGLTEGKHCSGCGEVLAKQQTVAALGHSFTNYVSNNDATCTQDGTKTAKCDRCDETNTITDTGSALGHNFGNDELICLNGCGTENPDLKAGTCGKNVNWKYNTSTQTLTIYGTGAMKSFESFLYVPWSSCINDISTVVIEKGVTTIGDGAFNCCNNLISITIPNSVTTICEAAFSNCINLSNVMIPSGVISIEDYAFYGCESLESIVLPDSVISVGYEAFRSCINLKNLKLSNSLLNIGDNAFAECVELLDIVIPKSVESIGQNAFAWCSSIGNIFVAQDNSEYSSQDGILFNKNKSSLIQFPACNEKTEYVIPDSVETIESHAFEDNKNLKIVTIPDSVISIEQYAFENCINLASVTLYNRNIKVFGSSFIDCFSLKDVYYIGTEKEWKALISDTYYHSLAEATVHCNYSSIQNSINFEAA